MAKRVDDNKSEEYLYINRAYYRDVPNFRLRYQDKMRTYVP